MPIIATSDVDMADEPAKLAAEGLSNEDEIDENTRKMDFETVKKLIREDQMTQWQLGVDWQFEGWLGN